MVDYSLMSKLSIVQLSSVHPTRDTRVFYKICKGFVRKGHNIELIIQHPKDEVLEGVPIKALPVAKSKFERFFKVVPSLFNKARKYPKETIMHFHDPELIPVGIILKGLGYTVIYDVHEDVTKDMLTKEWIPKPLRSFLSISLGRLEALSSRIFDGIVTVTDPIAERFMQSTQSVIQVRNYPIIPSERVTKTECEDKYIAYIGGITSRRGIPKIIDAIEIVEPKNIKLWLGGTFAEKGLFELVKAKKGWNRTNFLGWVNHDEMIKILRHAICGLLTLEVIPSHNESLNVKMFEYMLCGIPVISSDLKLPRQIINEHQAGIIIKENTPEEIANAIEYIYSNPNEAKEMGRRGQEAVMKLYNWENELNKLESFYRKLI